jgi:hypothetical protein
MMHYIGPTIPRLGVARNTRYSEIPAALSAAAEQHPFLLSLFVTTPQEVSAANFQIHSRKGAFYSLYNKALAINEDPNTNQIKE